MGVQKGDASMVQVTAVEFLRPNKVRIVLDDGTRYQLLKSVYEERPLEIGNTLDPREFAQWVLKRQYRSALEKAVSLLAQRAHSREEIRKKLTASGYSSETVDIILYKLDRHHLLDDRDFAGQFSRSKAGRLYGPHRISRELRFRGVSEEDSESALSEISEEQQRRDTLLLAEKALRRMKPGEESRKAMEKAIASIVRRGYDWELAREAVRQVFIQNDP